MYMKNQRFHIISNEYSSFFGSIAGGCLSLEEDIDGDGTWSATEKHYDFTKEDTARLLAIISLDGFIELCRAKGTSGMERFLEEHDIRPKTCLI